MSTSKLKTSSWLGLRPVFHRVNWQSEMKCFRSCRSLCRSACYVAALIVLVAHHRFGPGWVGVSSPARPKVRPEPQVVCAASLTWKWDDKLGEGTFKEAYMARVEGDGDYYGYTAGQKLVVKFMKAAQYNSGVRITEKDIQAQQLAQNYAEKFESVVKPQRGGEPLHVFFRVGKLVPSSKNHYHGKTLKVLEGENMLVELPLYGEFEKFNSNTGWSSGVGALPSAFSHWTWVESNGEHLICDLQGHRGLKGGPITLGGKDCPYYAFSDPAVLSKVSGTYGPADLGVKGQETWFSKHVCNDFCKSLGLQGKVPNCQSHFKTQTHTVYRPIR